MSKKVTMYRFKVSLIGERGQPINKLHRIIEVDGNAPFAMLHEEIFEAFDRFDPHMFKFLLTRQDIKNEQELYGRHEEVSLLDPVPGHGNTTVHNAAQFTIADAGLQEKDIIHYWFDFGDDWMHRLRLEKIFQINDDDPDSDGWYCRTAKRVGKSPPQYSEDSVWENNQEAVLMALAEPQCYGEILWGDLQEEGLDEFFVDQGWVTPCKQPDEVVSLTEAGKAMAAVIKQEIDEN
ncbi:plasmid pRiA4b ORF-3 family protein [Uruburuella testudinis]|uniref:Plasmid pRiA4b ORF-3 family protein n=1 Tax=Uruburuella testudinis TaxID=1282863 RepID=A0ABY4DP58_9NEIS|nr:plasmid pRiA4b ORF-3 family protein [Uruburuella testudinis]UOO80839.1 plasmid pRiA4b ORF-3 family protein [Uruburuella testudinis]